MRRMFAGVAALCAWNAVAGAQGDSMPDRERAVLAAEDLYVAAEVARDEAVLQRLVDDRFVLNRNGGGTLDKAGLSRIVMGMEMTGQTLSDRTVLVEGDIGVVFGTAELRFASEEGADNQSLHRYTSVYVNRDGVWKFLALQMTGLVERKAP